MKKLAMIFLSFVMVLSFSGCGNIGGIGDQGVKSLYLLDSEIVETKNSNGKTEKEVTKYYYDEITRTKDGLFEAFGTAVNEDGVSTIQHFYSDDGTPFLFNTYSEDGSMKSDFKGFANTIEAEKKYNPSIERVEGNTIYFNNGNKSELEINEQGIIMHSKVTDESGTWRSETSLNEHFSVDSIDFYNGEYEMHIRFTYSEHSVD